MKKLFLLVAAAALVTAGAAQAATVYQTGFEQPTYADGALIGQDGWYTYSSPAGLFAVQNAVVKSGSQALNATTIDGNGDTVNSFTATRNLGSVLSVGPTDILTLSYDQYLPLDWFDAVPDASRSLALYLRPSSSSSEHFAVLSTWKQPSMLRIGFGVDSAKLALGFTQTDLADKWSNMRIVVNNGAGICEAFFNNRSLGSFTLTPGAVTSLASIEIQATSPSFDGRDAYVDNLSLSLGPQPARVVGITNRAAHDPIISSASTHYQFKAWGQVTILGTDSFRLDDGSRMPITVVAPGFSGIGDGDYAAATGSLSGGTLTSDAGSVVKVH